MKKRKWLIILIVIFAGFSTPLALAITYLHKHPPLWYYVQFTESPRELPPRLIRPAFKFITGWELPRNADNLRAIFRGGRARNIFVRFDTDSDGISYIESVVNKAGGSFEAFDADKLKLLKKAGFSLFPEVSRWQKKIGVCLFDQDSIDSGRMFVYHSGLNIVIDDQRVTVYILATWRRGGFHIPEVLRNATHVNLSLFMSLKSGSSAEILIPNL
ncbi:MAG: hypothetical protein ACETVZ_07885 [Phycisphaerae bacterium]